MPCEGTHSQKAFFFLSSFLLGSCTWFKDPKRHAKAHLLKKRIFYISVNLCRKCTRPLTFQNFFLVQRERKRAEILQGCSEAEMKACGIVDLEAQKHKSDSDEEGGGGGKDVLKSKLTHSDSEDSSNDDDDDDDEKQLRWRPQRGEERLTGHVGARTQGMCIYMYYTYIHTYILKGKHSQKGTLYSDLHTRCNRVLTYRISGPASISRASETTLKPAPLKPLGKISGKVYVIALVQ